MKVLLLVAHVCFHVLWHDSARRTTLAEKPKTNGSHCCTPTSSLRKEAAGFHVVAGCFDLSLYLL